MSQQSRTQLALGFAIFFICEIFVLGLIPNEHSSQQTDSGIGTFSLNVIYNIEGMRWWSTLIFAPFVAFVAIFIAGLIPTVNMGE